MVILLNFILDSPNICIHMESKFDDCFVSWNIFLPLTMSHEKLNVAEKLLKAVESAHEQEILR